MALHDRLMVLCVLVLVSVCVHARSAASNASATVEIPLAVKQALAAGHADEALPWLAQAAEQGNGMAALYLGKLYQSGSGVNKDSTTARRYLLQSANAGIVEAQMMLGHLAQEEGDLQSARDWFQKAATSGNARAAGWLAADHRGENSAVQADVFRRIESGGPDLAGMNDVELQRRDATGATPLIRAVIAKKPDWVALLLSRHADVRAADHSGNTALHYAALSGSHESLAILLNAGAPTDARNGQGSTPLHSAVNQNQLHDAELLVAHGADPFVKDINGWTPAMLAERLGFTTSFSTGSTDEPRRVASTDDDRSGDILQAVRTGKTNRLEQMIAQGVEVNVLDAGGNSALHIAILQHHESMVGPLIDSGADVEVLNERGVSALMVAAREGDSNSLALLAKAGADLNVSDARGRTALHLSVLSNCASCIGALIESGAEVSVRDREGATPLLLALREFPALGAVLINASESALLVRDENGRDALWESVAAGEKDLVQKLLDAGMTLRADNEGVTPLHTAARLDHADIVSLLLQNGYGLRFLNDKTTAGNTALMLAAYHGSDAALKTLLGAGAGIDDQNAVGDTALHLAARQGNYPSARILVEAGASFNQRNEVSQSVRAIIESTNEPRWLELLTLGPSEIQRLFQRVTQN